MLTVLATVAEMTIIVMLVRVQLGQQKLHAHFRPGHIEGEKMSIRHIVGTGLALLSAAVLVFDVANGLSGAGLFGFVSLGDLWARISGASLNLVQAIVQRYLLPALWDPVLVTVLVLPAWPLLGGAAVLFLWRRNKSRNELLSGKRL